MPLLLQLTYQLCNLTVDSSQHTQLGITVLSKAYDYNWLAVFKVLVAFDEQTEDCFKILLMALHAAIGKQSAPCVKCAFILTTFLMSSRA